MEGFVTIDNLITLASFVGIAFGGWIFIEKRAVTPMNEFKENKFYPFKDKQEELNNSCMKKIDNAELKIGSLTSISEDQEHRIRTLESSITDIELIKQDVSYIKLNIDKMTSGFEELKKKLDKNIKD